MNAVRIILKNIAQVLLLNNAWTGLFILLGLFVGNWKVGIMALAASVIALLLAKRTNYSNEE
ncbi:urea transporter, partial [Staphylococcus cohnii]